MDTYRAHSLEGASGVELTIALYDGIIRFMHNAIDAIDREDVDGRRAAVKRAMDIVIHLQATLDKDIGGDPAKSLSEFYVAMFALMLQGSQAQSKKKFEQVIANVRIVRDAWKQVAAGFGPNQRSQKDESQSGVVSEAAWMQTSEARTASSWTV
jgi:flagellar protein FliS